MASWQRRIGGAVATALAWAVLWAPVGVMIGLIVDPDGSMDEMWVAIGAYPGFLSGLLFHGILAMAERGRKMAELPLSRVSLWGAVAGTFVGALPFFIGTPDRDIPLWQFALLAIGIFTVMGTVSAIGSAMVARTRYFGVRYSR